MHKYLIKKIYNLEEIEDELIDLWKKNFGSDKYDIKRFKWLYQQRTDSPTNTWLASIENTTTLVGCGSNYPRFFYINGECIKGAIAYDFAILREHRVYGPALALQKTIVKDSKELGFELLFVYPNKVSSGVFKSAGFKFIGNSDCWERIIKSKNQIGSRIKLTLISKLLSKLFDIFLHVHHRFLSNKSFQDFQTSITDKCDADFDELFNHNKAKNGIVADQSSQFLNWRYSECYQVKYNYFCLHKKNNKRLEAFILYTINGNTLNIKEISSYTERNIETILWFFIQFAQKNHFDMIVLNFFGRASFDKLLKKHLFIKRPTNRDYLFHFSEKLSKNLVEQFQNKENYFFFFG